MINRETLNQLTTEELLELQKIIEEILQERKKQTAQVYTFQFEATCDPRKGTPYVAKLTLSEEGKIQREFYALNRTYGKKEITVFGKFEAQEGDIIEMRKASSWKNDWREAYIVKGGELKWIGYTARDSKTLTKIIQYLKGDITEEELIKDD